MALGSPFVVRGATAAVTRDRPDLPKGYISRTPKGMLTWADAERILRPKQYIDGHAFRARATKVIVFDVKDFDASATRFTFGRA